MYRVAFTFKGHGLEPLLDKLLNTDGVAELTLDRLRPAKAAPAAQDKAAAKPKGKRVQAKPGAHHGTVLDIIKTTFPDSEFGPKQVVGVAVSRGVPKASFYGIMHELAKQGKLARPKPGYYKLVTEERKE